jgi:hypothetical protein
MSSNESRLELLCLVKLCDVRPCGPVEAYRHFGVCGSVFCDVKVSSAYTKALHCLSFRMNTKLICRFKGEMRIPAI